MAYILMAYIVMAYMVMAYIVTAYIVMAYIVMACIGTAYRYGLQVRPTGMAHISRREPGRLQQAQTLEVRHAQQPLLAQHQRHRLGPRRVEVAVEHQPLLVRAPSAFLKSFFKKY